MKEKILLISAVVIAAGSIVLVQMNRSGTQEAGGLAAVQPKQSAQTPADFRTAAGVGEILDLDFQPDVFEAALDADFPVDEYAVAAETEDAEESEYANLAIAQVSSYVNVRSEPNTVSEVVGKMYDGSVAQILATAGENNEWFQVVSGNVEGYIKAEYFIYGDAAVSAVDDYVTRYAVVQVERLNVRQEPDISSGRIGYIDSGERVELVEWGDEWSRVNYTAEKQGYVASMYVTVAEEFVYAKSIEEEQKELAALQELQARTQASEEAAPERMMVSAAPPQTNYATVSELRTAVVDYAMQYLGNKYVHGGQSLAAGTDCSGFTCYVYKTFGYSLSRTPQGQYTSAGRGIDMSQIQPGDVICYSSNGSTCTHVGLYIGNGQIIHSANPRKGVIISNYDYDGVILGVRSIVD